MKRLTRIKGVLWALAMFGLVAIVARLINGLGATTNLSDALPWGLWKVGNMVAGVALGTCGFAIAAAVYAFKLERYQKLARPAVLIAFLGYGSSCFSLFLDIGLPWRIWHAIVYWNIHSFLFEVAWCVMLYFSITLYETAPVILERTKFHKLAHTMHRVAFPIILLGISLSTLHHTSLGSLFLVSPTRVHEIWMTMLIPVLFITSAVGAGLLTLVLITLMYNYLYDKKPDLDVLGSVAKAGAILLSIYAIIKGYDIVNRDIIPVILSGQWEGILFIFESILLVFIPVGIIFSGLAKKSANLMAIAAGSAVIGVVLNRLDVGILSYFRTAGAVYYPSLPEIFTTLGIYSAAGLFFFFMVENFEVFDKPPVRPKDAGEAQSPDSTFGPIRSFGDGVLRNPIHRYSAIAVVSLVLAVGLFSSSLLKGAPMLSEKVAPPTALDNERMVLVINGNKNDVSVAFRHDMHKAMLGGTQSCIRCHHLDMPDDKNTACWKCHTNMEQKTDIFKHAFHQEKLGGNDSCVKCHTDTSRPRWRDNTKKCYECHEENMGMLFTADDKSYDYMAPSYVDAMHKKCVGCHIEMQNTVDRPALDECYTCHGDVKLQTVR